MWSYFADMEKLTCIILTGLHNVQSACTNQQELRDVTLLTGEGIPSRAWGRSEIGLEEAEVPKSISVPHDACFRGCLEEPCELGKQGKVRPWGGTYSKCAWSFRGETVRLSGGARWVEIAGELWGCWASHSGHPCLDGQPHPAPGLLQMDVANMPAYSNRTPYPTTVPLPQLLRNLGKLWW